LITKKSRKPIRVIPRVSKEEGNSGGMPGTGKRREVIRGRRSTGGESDGGRERGKEGGVTAASSSGGRTCRRGGGVGCLQK